ncbi:MAG: class I SAM-dependent methyltransferase [Actinomycetia bacterium]|nr:class I SAM-dependent methyltransferase [Actinomycetes bacterium]
MEWTPSPRHLLRVGCISDVTANWQPGTVLEVGAGTGDVTNRFVERGFTVTATDLGSQSRQLLRQRFGHEVTVVDDLESMTSAIDYLFAFEVLEHINDDLGALRSWVAHLRPGGRVLISVPAHQRKFGDPDRAAGHVRRYERHQLMALLDDAGLIEAELSNYGFPLGNAIRLTRTGINSVTRRRVDEPEAETERMARTVDSGVATARTLNRLKRLSTPRLLAPFVAIQSLAYQRDWSDGYVATATRPPA